MHKAAPEAVFLLSKGGTTSKNLQIKQQQSD